MADIKVSGFAGVNVPLLLSDNGDGSYSLTTADRLRGGTPTVNVIAVGATPQVILPSNTNRRLAIITVDGSGTLYLGTTNQVAPGNGYPVSATAQFPQLGDGAGWWGVAKAADGTISVRVVEWS